MNVLVATDGSKYGKWALEWVATLPLVQTPTVQVLHVVETGSLRAPLLVQPVVAGNERFIREELRRMEERAASTLAQAKDQLRRLRLAGRVNSEQGTAAATILDHAPKKNGLVVVGSQGRDALDRFMLGSVSTNVVHHAPCPVLVAKTEAEPLERVMLAVDGSTSAHKAVDFLIKKIQPEAVRGGKSRPIHVTVIHVMPYLKYPELREAGAQLVDQQVLKLLKAGYSAEGLSRLGKPADEIIKAASKQRSQLIVMGAKGLGAIARFLLGSVSTRVVQQARCSVLVVR